SRARRVAAAAAFGGGGLGALGAAGIGLLAAEAKMARRWIGTPFGKQGPDGSGWYGKGAGPVIEMAMLGDSSAVGLGVTDPQETPGAVIAAGLAAITGRPVRLRVAAVVGAESRHLDAQVDRLVADMPCPDLAVIMVGANDVTHRTKPEVAVRALGEAVRRLRELGAEVVVGTCPDLGTIEPIAQPLRYLTRRWSRELAAAQTIGVVEAGGRSVSLADLIGEEFAARRRELFSADRFHPSAAGYARAAAVLLPSVCAALGIWPEGLPDSGPDLRRGEGKADVAQAAVRAASSAGTEVSGTDVNGATRGPRGRWALLLRRPALPALPAMPNLAGLANLPNLTNLPGLPSIPGLAQLGSRLRGGSTNGDATDRPGASGDAAAEAAPGDLGR
ncbi:MAG TPA: SGNH/GDSL hydrolase family protein, partial [Kineosporiaceae bacterium]|nr:SGNH/GDSL hydrolase family protein [Kineosporiaceae bacterium]